MGADGTWQRVQTIAVPLQARDGDLQCYRVAVDMACVMHAALAHRNAAAKQVLEGNPSPRPAVERVVCAIRALQPWCREVIAVFDGATRPGKAAVVAKCQQQRADAAAKAEQLNGSGSHDRATRRKLMAAVHNALHLTAEYKREFILAMRELGVHVVGSPYEADGQCARLFLKGRVDAVMTTDSDLLCLGCVVLRMEHKPSKTLDWITTGELRCYDIATAVRVAPVTAPVVPISFGAWEKRCVPQGTRIRCEAWRMARTLFEERMLSSCRCGCSHARFYCYGPHSRAAISTTDPTAAGVSNTWAPRAATWSCGIFSHGHPHRCHGRHMWWQMP
jgi:CDGSH-type Zn-finger protein